MLRHLIRSWIRRRKREMASGVKQTDRLSPATKRRLLIISVANTSSVRRLA